jgi:hypothetical protein
VIRGWVSVYAGPGNIEHFTFDAEPWFEAFPDKALATFGRRPREYFSGQNADRVFSWLLKNNPTPQMAVFGKWIKEKGGPIRSTELDGLQVNAWVSRRRSHNVAIGAVNYLLSK